MRKILMIFIFCLIFVSCNDLSKNEGNDSMNNFAIYTDEEGNAVLEEKKPIFNVNYTPNIIYTNKDGIDLSLQILTPKLKRNDTNSKYPLVLFIQGSRWMKQNVYQNLVVMGDFARRGYVVSIVEYRPSDKAIFPAQIEDTRDAINFMINNANKYNIDTNSIVETLKTMCIELLKIMQPIQSFDEITSKIQRLDRKMNELGEF